MLGVAERVREPEIMDRPGLDEAAHLAALRGLRRINAVSGTAAALWRHVAAAAGRVGPTSGRPLRVLDVACGGGDVAVALARRAEQTGTPMELTACDVSDTALRGASGAAATAGVRLQTRRLDALRDPLPAADLAVSSLFLHHLSDAEATALLASLAHSVEALAIDDLDRSPMGLAACLVGTRALSRSPVVHVDGPRSVRAAFTAEEAAALAATAGLRGATARRRWPFRWTLAWRRA